MATTPLRLFDTAQLTGSAATYYTSPALTKTIIKKATFTNSDVSTPYTVTLYLIKTGGSASTSNIIMNAAVVAPSATLEAFEIEGQVLNPGDFIQAFASTTGKIVFAASGVQIT